MKRRSPVSGVSGELSPELGSVSSCNPGLSMPSIPMPKPKPISVSLSTSTSSMQPKELDRVLREDRLEMISPFSFNRISTGREITMVLVVVVVVVCWYSVFLDYV